MDVCPPRRMPVLCTHPARQPTSDLSASAGQSGVSDPPTRASSSSSSDRTLGMHALRTARDEFRALMADARAHVCDERSCAPLAVRPSLYFLSNHINVVWLR